MANDDSSKGGRLPKGEAGIEDPYGAPPLPPEAYPTPDEDPDGSGRSMMSTYLGIAAVVVVLVLILVAVVISRSSDDDQPNADPSTTEPSEGDEADTTEQTEPEKTERGWPDSVQGRPAGFGTRDTPPPADAGSLAPGAYLWIDFNGWHLWIVRGPGVEGITGRIELDAEPTRAAPAVEGEGQVAIDGNAIVFDLTDAEAEVVGVEFNTFYAGTMNVSLESSEGPIDAGNVHIGRKETPSPNPIAVAKEG